MKVVKVDPNTRFITYRLGQESTRAWHYFGKPLPGPAKIIVDVATRYRYDVELLDWHGTQVMLVCVDHCGGTKPFVPVDINDEDTTPILSIPCLMFDDEEPTRPLRVRPRGTGQIAEV